MKSWDETRQWLRQQTRQAGRISGGNTLLEIVGRDRLVIERHRGISCYADEQIQIRTSYGYLLISGCGLRLCCMSREQLCITGRIDGVKLMGRDGNGAVE